MAQRSRLIMSDFRGITEKEIAKLEATCKSTEYQYTLKWVPGGQYSQIITAITAATGSNVMCGFNQLAQAGQGGNCASAGLGTAAGVIANAVLNNPHAMTSEEKKAREDLITTLVAGAAAAAGGDAGSAVAGVQVEQENNALSFLEGFGKGFMDYGQSVASYAQYAHDHNIPPEKIQADLARMVEGDAPEGSDMIKAILENTPVSDTIMALLTAKEAKDYALALLTSIPAERALALVSKAVKVIDNKFLISAAEKISTAKPGKQFTAPRDLNEQVVWNQVKENPKIGKALDGMNNDPRFPTSAGFQKMEAKQKLSDGSTITVHYQYNSTTGKAYDMKITTPQRIQPDPQDVISNIKDKIR